MPESADIPSSISGCKKDEMMKDVILGDSSLIYGLLCQTVNVISAADTHNTKVNIPIDI